MNPTRAVTSPAWRVPLDRYASGKLPDMAREVVKLSRSTFGNGILPLLFPKEPVPASPPTPPSGQDVLFQDTRGWPARPIG